MGVPVVQVWVVRVAMHHRRVPVDVDVRLPHSDVRRVFMPVMAVVNMGVLVDQLLVLMVMLVVFNQVQV